MAKDLYIQSNFNEYLYIRRDDINGSEDTIYNCQVRNSPDLPTEVGRFAKGCEILIVDTGAEYNNTSNTTTPNWTAVGGGTDLTFTNGLFETAGTVKLGAPLIENTNINIDGFRMSTGGRVNTTAEVQWGILDPLGVGNNVFVAPFYNDIIATEPLTLGTVFGDLTGYGGNPFSRLTLLTSATSDRQFLERSDYDDGRGVQSPLFNRTITSGDSSISTNHVQDSREFSLSHVDENTHTQNRVRIINNRAELEFDFDDGTDFFRGIAKAEKLQSFVESTRELNGQPLILTGFNASANGGRAKMYYNSDASTAGENSLELGDAVLAIGPKVGDGYTIPLTRGAVGQAIVQDALGEATWQTIPVAPTTPLIETRTTPPTSTPTKTGDIFIDSVLALVYISTGTTGPGDWTLLN